MTLASWTAGLFGGRRGDEKSEREIVKTDAEWRDQLTPEQYQVLRRSGTERPFSAEGVKPGADGMYRCGACDAVLFRADTKFDSGTGWPSFTDGEADAVELRRESGLGDGRTEVLCRRCGGHLGHVFSDGPAPTGKRYCINGCALAPGDESGRTKDAS